MRRATTWAAGFVVLSLAAGAAAQVKPTDERVPCRDHNDVFALFDRLGYTQQAWQAGIREVPRVYLEDIPERWRERSSTVMTVGEKKRIFFRLIAPIVLRINELIAADRARAKEVTERLALAKGVSPEDQAWLGELALRYKLIGSPGDRLDSDQYAELLLRVDIVPVSISLAQAASESGWGTSRFAAEGNSLFRQWSWGKGLKPTAKIEDTGFYVQAAFYPVPKKLELYGATSQIYGDGDAGFGDSSEYILGLNFYPFKTRDHRLNLQVIDVNRSPVSSTFGYYVGGQDGTTVSAAFSIFF